MSTILRPLLAVSVVAVLASVARAQPDPDDLPRLRGESADGRAPPVKPDGPRFTPSPPPVSPT